MKKLKPTEALPMLLDRSQYLGDKLKVILFQLPPHWKMNLDRLTDFLESLPSTYRYSFEFRDISWHNHRIYELLTGFNAAFCIFDIGGMQSPILSTTDFVYVRLHGPSNEPYKGQYDEQALSSWAKAITAWNREGKNVYCYFDNDENGYAAQDALRLKKIIRS
jgi:uncharacterized protein YecE (DUF72 family)